MLPIGLLMKEHRLIERMIKLMGAELQNIKDKASPNNDFIDRAIDFIKTYADRCHHGKEEDILFRDLKKKNISPEHEAVMNKLIQEHVLGRETVVKLNNAKTLYAQGDKNAQSEVMKHIEKLVNFYPKHIAKEDKEFFLPCMEYFNDDEKSKMLKECYDFDRQLIHEKYTKVVEGFE